MPPSDSTYCLNNSTPSRSSSRLVSVRAHFRHDGGDLDDSEEDDDVMYSKWLSIIWKERKFLINNSKILGNTHFWSSAFFSWNWRSRSTGFIFVKFTKWILIHWQETKNHFLISFQIIKMSFSLFYLTSFFLNWIFFVILLR